MNRNFNYSEQFLLIKHLNNELNSRRIANKQYSLRAFARDLKLDASQLSKILKGKLPLTCQFAIKICDNLKLNEKDKTLFVDNISQIRSCSNRECEKDDQAHGICDLTGFLKKDCLRKKQGLSETAVLNIDHLTEFLNSNHIELSIPMTLHNQLINFKKIRTSEQQESLQISLSLTKN
jgi:transcriptional regulator with XRE-family HTH domain